MAENYGILLQWLIFLGVAFTSILGSVLLITRKNPIHSALFLVLTLVCVAVLYFLLYSPFIAVIQVIVYAGAIAMLIVFVIMLLDLEEELRSGLKLFYSKIVGGALAHAVPFRNHLCRGWRTPLRESGSLYPCEVGRKCEGGGRSSFYRVPVPL